MKRCVRLIWRLRRRQQITAAKKEYKKIIIKNKRETEDGFKCKFI
ncbi:MAG: hypothetical protein ACFFG0_02170 [Candidatus Thorarchaeota archaeon]